jgi:LmbE family N-acetylglucosaminyl deacetylase
MEAQSWREIAAHLAGSSRVLLIGTRPEDEDNALIALLSRGMHIETAYLSLTRGEAGVNVLGSESGAALAVVRSAELRAERQRDGARQYFSRAFDFGAVEADSTVAAAWPRDSLLVDVVSVIRAFRPHAIIVLASAAGQRDATGRYTRQLVVDAVATASDTVTIPASVTAQLGAWRASRLFAAGGTIANTARTVRLNVGAFAADELRSYAELGAEIRSLQRTQPARSAPTPGRLVQILERLDHADDNSATLFAPEDTSFARFDTIVPASSRAQFDTLQALLGVVTSATRSERADTSAARLARLVASAQTLARSLGCVATVAVPRCPGASGDFAMLLRRVVERGTRAMLDAAGIVIDVVAAREMVARDDTVALTISVRNGGTAPVTIRGVVAFHPDGSASGDIPRRMVLAPDSLVQFPGALVLTAESQHWWQFFGMQSRTQLHVADPSRSQLIRGEDRIGVSGVTAQLIVGSVVVPISVGPIVARTSTTLRGDVRHPVIGVSEASLLFERGAEYERAGLPINRLFRVLVTSHRSAGDTVRVELTLPKGVNTDSAVRIIALPPFGSRSVLFPLRGALPPGPAVVTASARSLRVLPEQAVGVAQTGALREFTQGTVITDYPHIPSQHFTRRARDRIESVEVRVPPMLRIGYVRGSEDLRSALAQLRLSVVPIDIALLPAYDLTGITTLLLGAGAMRSESAASAVPALQAFAARGGTIVVLNGGGEVARSGLFPYPIAMEFGGGRAANDTLDVRVGEPRSPLLAWPNMIMASDYRAWRGDRTCGRITLADSRYRAPLGVIDTRTKAVLPAILATTVGRGMLVLSTLCLGNELEAAQTGAARIVVNLLSAGLQRP